MAGSPAVRAPVSGPACAGPPVGGPAVAGSPGVETFVAGPAVAGPAVDDETFAGALALREAIDSAITAIVASGTAPERDVRCVNDWIVAGSQRPVLRLEAGCRRRAFRGRPARRARLSR